jgi:hypothetical protein
MFTIATNLVPAQESKRGKITCVTCKLKKCVGRCHFERIDVARTPKAA